MAGYRSRRSALDGASTKTLHTQQPSVYIIAFASHISFDFRVRKDMESFFPQCLYYDSCQLIRFDDAIGLTIAEASRQWSDRWT